MKTCISILIALLLLGCKCTQTSDSNINSADYVWINTFKELPMKNDSSINVFKYNQLVNGYEVTGWWMPFETHRETGRSRHLKKIPTAPSSCLYCGPIYFYTCSPIKAHNVWNTKYLTIIEVRLCKGASNMSLCKSLSDNNERRRVNKCKWTAAICL